MLVLMKCIAEAVAAKGVKGLAEWVPGGPYLYDVGHDALRRLRERRRHEQLRDEIRLAAEASFAETQRAAAEVVREVVPIAPVEDRVALELYLSQVPGAVRRSLRRADDPTGRTVPPGFALNTPDDLVKLLPPQMPRFRTGDDVPGRLGWKLTEPLGAGGFGEVWRVENPENGEEWAVKFCTNAAARHRLLKHEQVLVKRVQRETAHPHIVKLKDALLIETVEVPWLAYEYVGGGDLAGLILSWQRLSAEERLALALETLAVLASTAGHFHGLNPPIVHRDLKPANILRDATTGQLRVTDFGIGGIAAANLLSSSRDGATAYTRAVSMLSGAYTPIYASPQQQRGDDPDPRDDVHALGVIAYQMFTGRLDAGPGPKFERDLQKQGVPADVIQLIGDCVDPVPEDRIANGGSLLKRLEAGTFGAKRREAERAKRERLAAEDRRQEEKAAAEASEATERRIADNLRCWVNSGWPERWVEAKNGNWTHEDWMSYIRQLQQSDFWPLSLDAVAQSLERVKESYSTNRPMLERQVTNVARPSNAATPKRAMDAPQVPQLTQPSPNPAALSAEAATVLAPSTVSIRPSYVAVLPVALGIGVIAAAGLLAGFGTYTAVSSRTLDNPFSFTWSRMEPYLNIGLLIGICIGIYSITAILLIGPTPTVSDSHSKHSVYQLIKSCYISSAIHNKINHSFVIYTIPLIIGIVQIQSTLVLWLITNIILDIGRWNINNPKDLVGAIMCYGRFVFSFFTTYIYVKNRLLRNN
jgi:serine/threonine protein kinase